MLTPEQVKQYQTQYGIAPANPTGPLTGPALLNSLKGTPKEPGFFEGAKQDIQGAAQGALSSRNLYDQGKQGLASGLFQTAGAVGQGIANIAGRLPVIKHIGEIGSKVADVTGDIGNAIGNKVSDILPQSANKAINQNVAQPLVDIGTQLKAWAEKHPEAARNFEAIPGIAQGLLTLYGGAEAATGIPGLAKGAVDLAKKAPPIGEAVQGIKSAAGKVYDSIPGTGKIAEAIDNTQNYIARSSAPENMGTSIDRLTENATRRDLKTPEEPNFTRNKDGKMKLSPKKTTPVKDPLAAYDEFYTQEQKFKGDIKQDPALSMVGERTGVAYDKVAQMRRAAGKAQAAELEKIGNIKTNINDSQAKLGDELTNNGLKVNNKGEVSATKKSKVTAQDRALIGDYVAQVRKLGSNPTAAELDAFISRYTGEVDVYKSQNNITKVTNGERIVKANLNELRSALKAEANPKFEAYSKAKADYSSLTDVLDEGAKYLGKKTLSGDYAKDASVAKSSVQSILNNGKKDFLLKLEDLTGYPAIDEAMLAIKAMQDAGNFRGNSLLELLSPKDQGGGTPNIPTSGRGAIMKGVEKAYEYGKEKLAGTPNEQTRRFIIERMKQGKTEIPSQIP